MPLEADRGLARAQRILIEGSTRRREDEAVAHKLWINPGLWMTAPTTREELVVGGEIIGKEEFVRRENDRLRTFAYQHGVQDSQVEHVFLCRCGFEAKNASAAWDHARRCRVRGE